MVADGTVDRDPQSLRVAFDVTDFDHNVRVTYEGILPDLFREGQGVVVQGRISGDEFLASEVLAKHDENYMPPGHGGTETVRQARSDDGSEEQMIPK